MAWYNPIVGLLLDELAEWRAALPTVAQLLHPKMRTAQWQKVFATVPPPDEVMKLHMEKALFDDETPIDDEQQRKKIADELAKQRAPGTMCIKTLWENPNLQSYLPAIAQQLETTLARERQAATSSPGSKGASPRKKKSRPSSRQEQRVEQSSANKAEEASSPL